MKKSLFALVLLAGVGLAINSHAARFTFCPSVSVFGGYTITKNYPQNYAGKFDIENRKFNFGLSLTNKCYLSPLWFINTGVRYTNNRIIIHGKNQMPALFDNPDPLNWHRGYETFALPILAGKDFRTSNGHRGDIFAGCSIGILMTAYAKDELETVLPRNVGNRDMTGWSITDPDEMPSRFYISFDLGANYHPFKKLPGFSAGILCSFQLNKSKVEGYQGLGENFSTGETYPYSIENQNRFINGSLVLSYTFDKKRPAIRDGKFNCPNSVTP